MSEKPVRKYNKMQQVGRWGYYFMGIGLSTSYSLLLIGGVAVSVAASIGLVFFFLSNPSPWPLCVLPFPLMLTKLLLEHLNQHGLECKPDTFLNPVEPTDNPILPTEETLVRPSSASNAPPIELLRAATEEPREELLRASDRDEE